MKVPRIFISDKNLDQKIEELKKPKRKGIRELTLEDFMKDNMRILLGGLASYKQNKILDDTFSKIVNDTFKGEIIWEKDCSASNLRYKAEAPVINYKRKCIIIPVVFQTARIIQGQAGREGFLYLGDENGPCKNSADNRIKELAKKYFKIRNIGPKYTI